MAPTDPSRSRLLTTMSRLVRVAQVRDVAEGIRELFLVPSNGWLVPPFTPGAHIACEVVLPDGSAALRQYSLINPADERDGFRIAVARVPNGKGGSAFMHRLQPGDSLPAGPVRNDFPLSEAAASHLLIAGGIGITPILGMARALLAAGRAFDLHYVGRHRGGMAYAEEVAAMPRAAVVCDDGDPAKGLDIPALAATRADGRHLYVCGPRPMIEATLAHARKVGWPDVTLHFELFGAEAPQPADRAFTVRFARSGREAEIAAGDTILAAMERLGLDPLFDCRRGECGICVTDVLDGAIDHRDMNLSPREKREGKLICTCVSRASGEHLVLDA